MLKTGTTAPPPSSHSMILPESSVLLKVPETRRGALVCRMARHLANALGIADSEAVEHELLEREMLGSTGIGSGVALPHVRTPLVYEPHAVLAVPAEPVDFGAYDTIPVQIVLFLAVPCDMDSAEYIRLMAQITRVLAREEVRAAVRAARTPRQALTALAGMP